MLFLTSRKMIVCPRSDNFNLFVKTVLLFSFFTFKLFNCISLPRAKSGGAKSKGPIV